MKENETSSENVIFPLLTVSQHLPLQEITHHFNLLVQIWGFLISISVCERPGCEDAVFSCNAETGAKRFQGDEVAGGGRGMGNGGVAGSVYPAQTHTSQMHGVPSQGRLAAIPTQGKVLLVTKVKNCHSGRGQL